MSKPQHTEGEWSINNWPQGDGEYGDSYVKDVKSGNTRTYVDPTLSNI